MKGMRKTRFALRATQPLPPQVVATQRCASSALKRFNLALLFEDNPPEGQPAELGQPAGQPAGQPTPMLIPYRLAA